MRLKKVFIVFLMLSVFAVGTLSFSDTVDAAKWKKYDSGTFKSDGIKFSYKTYIKGTKEMRMDLSCYGAVISKTYLTKTKKGVRYVSIDYKGKIVQNDLVKSPFSLKANYKIFKKAVIKEMKK